MFDSRRSARLWPLAICIKLVGLLVYLYPLAVAHQEPGRAYMVDTMLCLVAGAGTFWGLLSFAFLPTLVEIEKKAYSWSGHFLLSALVVGFAAVGLVAVIYAPPHAQAIALPLLVLAAGVSIFAACRTGWPAIYG